MSPEQDYDIHLDDKYGALSLIEIPAEAAADLGSWPTTSCPILLWAVEVAAWDLDQLLARLGLSHSGFEMVESHNAFVVLRK